MFLSRLPFLASLVALTLSSAAWAADAPKPSGEKFAAAPVAGQLRALLVGGGSSHDFEKFFHQADSEILRGAMVEPVYTESVEEAVALLPQADVVVISTNQGSFGAPAFQDALKTFAESGKGVVILHPGAWYNWPATTGYNQTFVGGGAKSHDALGKFTVTVKDPSHPIMKGVEATFEVKDELYQVTLDPAAQVTVLAETSTSGVTMKAHPSVWLVAHPKARIVGIALGHDGAVHDLPAFKSILANAVHWAGEKK